MKNKNKPKYDIVKNLNKKNINSNISKLESKLDISYLTEETISNPLALAHRWPLRRKLLEN